MPTLRDTGDLAFVSRIAALQDKTSFKELHWEGTFEEYLRFIRENPRVTRTAFQRIYDMILSHGKTEYIDNKKRLIRYHFFHDEPSGGRDASGFDVAGEPIEFLAHVGFGRDQDRFLVQPVGIEALRLCQQCRDLFGEPRADRLRLASRRLIGARGEDANLAEPGHQHLTER